MKQQQTLAMAAGFEKHAKRTRRAEFLFQRVNGYLESRGVRLGTGRIVDATLIEAPSSTKNKEGQRDPEMHQVRKGNQWHFGMKAHIGVDAETKLVHTVTAANVAAGELIPS